MARRRTSERNDEPAGAEKGQFRAVRVQHSFQMYGRAVNRVVHLLGMLAGLAGTLALVLAAQQRPESVEVFRSA